MLCGQWLARAHAYRTVFFVRSFCTLAAKAPTSAKRNQQKLKVHGHKFWLHFKHRPHNKSCSLRLRSNVSNDLSMQTIWQSSAAVPWVPHATTSLVRLNKFLLVRATMAYICTTLLCALHLHSRPNDANDFDWNGMLTGPTAPRPSVAQQASSKQPEMMYCRHDELDYGDCY